MTKPFSPEELLARLRVLCRRKGEVVLDELCVGDVRLALASSELFSTVGDKRVHLNYKEAELMRLLLGRPRMILPKEEIIVKVWGYDSDVADNTVEAYVSFLRKKLAFVGSRAQIVSVKKIGYKLEV